MEAGIQTNPCTTTNPPMWRHCTYDVRSEGVVLDPGLEGGQTSVDRRESWNTSGHPPWRHSHQEAVAYGWSPAVTLQWRHGCQEMAIWALRHIIFVTSHLLHVIVMPTIFQALNKRQKLNQNKIRFSFSFLSLSHFLSFLTVYLLFKCRFAAWQSGSPWKFAYCVLVSK